VPPVSKLPVGSKVIIRNMVGLPRRRKVGTIRGWSVARNRYWVLFEDQGTVVETLPGDLMQFLDNIEISGVLDRPELNGLSSTIQLRLRSQVIF